MKDKYNLFRTDCVYADIFIHNPVILQDTNYNVIQYLCVKLCGYNFIYSVLEIFTPYSTDTTK